MWTFLPEEIEASMLAAIAAFGAQVLAPWADGEDRVDQAGVGRRLLQLVYGTGAGELPEVVAALIDDPDSEDAREELVHRAFAAFNADPAKVAAADAMMVGLYRQRAEDGDAETLVELGHFLYRADPAGARAAFQQAIDAGHLRAMLDLANFLERVNGDKEAALAVYRQAAAAGDPELAAEALYDILMVHQFGGDAAAADAAFQEVAATGHAVFAAAAMVRVAEVVGQDDPAAAEALYRQAMEIGDAHWSACAAVQLGELLEAQGDVAGAKAAWQQVIDAADPDWADAAFLNLVNLLRGQEDADGLRAAHQAGTAVNNPEALYALDQLGELLRRQGDPEGGHAVWQQAIDAGYENAASLRERMSPSPQRGRRFRAESYPPDLPPAFNPGNMRATAAEVLEYGLPDLPEPLAYDMAVPIAYWKAEHTAIVLILDFSWWEDEWSPAVLEATFTREGGAWTPDRHWHGMDWAHDPIAHPRSLRDLGGRPMVTGGGSDCSAHGRVAPTVAEIGLAQNGQEHRRPVDSHFGAWVVCTDQPDPFRVTAYDISGTLLSSIGSS